MAKAEKRISGQGGRGPQNNPSIAAPLPPPPPAPPPAPQTTVGAEARAIAYLTPLLERRRDAMSKAIPAVFLARCFRQARASKCLGRSSSALFRDAPGSPNLDRPA